MNLSLGETLQEASIANSCKNHHQDVHAYQSTPNPMERFLCLVRSCRFDHRPLVSMALLVAINVPAKAQEIDENPASSEPGSSVGGQEIVEPLIEFIAAIGSLVASFASLILQSAAAAILISATIAAIVAWRSISSQREMTRLRETFNTINRGVWDKDLIRNRNRYREIRENLTASQENTGKYHRPKTKREIVDSAVLHNLLKDYENLALGVRNDILDEQYLCRWMRTNLIQDWRDLSPLVIAYRSVDNAATAYIEFEGIANAWRNNVSYRTGKPLDTPGISIDVS